MTTRLQLYNSAMLILGERSIASLTEETKKRRVLDHIWDTGGVKKCLEQGQWNFAKRTVMLDFDPDVEPNFGYRRAYNKPTDWVLTSAVCSDEFFTEPLIGYVDEAHYWYADIDIIYVRYVSDDPQYGLNINEWPGNFENFVASYFAYWAAFDLSSSEERRKKAEEAMEKFKKEALNKDAMANPTKFPAPGNWVRSRTGSRSHERGNQTGNLY